MPIGNITQIMSTISPPPHRGVDVQTVFVNKQEDFQDHLADITIDELNTLKDQLNTRIGEINSTVTTMNGYADTASAGASTATTKAGEASTSATTATTKAGEASTSATAALNSKNQASTFATISAKWADSNYNVLVEAGKYSAKHWATEAQNATANKVDKVTSHDNAIVRFDGATGVVQNSRAIIDDNGNLLLTSGTGALGYGAGAGGTVTQLISKTDSVTLNKPSGRIIMHPASLAAGASAKFALYNSLISHTDLVYCVSTTNTSVYRVDVVSVFQGGCRILVKNEETTAFASEVPLAFCIIKGAIS